MAKLYHRLTMKIPFHAAADRLLWKYNTFELSLYKGIVLMLHLRRIAGMFVVSSFAEAGCGLYVSWLVAF